MAIDKTCDLGSETIQGITPLFQKLVAPKAQQQP
jgi:hypothetical protein